MFTSSFHPSQREIYRRRIRSKSESLQKRYEQEGKFRKELEFKMKEIAMRPTHGHHHHLLERPKNSESQDSTRQFALSKSEIANHQKFLTNITQNTAYFSIPKAPVATQKYKLFTGNTPLTSRTSLDLSPTGDLRLFTGTTPIPSSRAAELTRPSTTYLTAGTKTIPLSISSSTGVYARSSSPSTKVEAIHMEPRDVAATTHAIALGRLQKEEARPPFPGIMLLSKDDRPCGQCPLEKAFVIPSRSETLVSSGDKRSTTGSVHTSSKEPAEKSPAPSRTAITAHGYVLHSLMNELSASPVVSNEKMDNVPSDIIERKLRRSSDDASPKDVEKKRKRKRKSTREQPLNVPASEVSPPPPASAFFPYWSGYRKTIAKIESMPSTSGKPPASQVKTSETTHWEPQTKSSRSPRKRSASSHPGNTSKIKTTRQSSLEAPLNVYELRLRAEKAKAAQIAKRMQEVEKPAETQGGAHLKENVIDSKRLLPSRPEFRQSDDRPLY